VCVLGLYCHNTGAYGFVLGNKELKLAHKIIYSSEGTSTARIRIRRHERDAGFREDVDLRPSRWSAIISEVYDLKKMVRSEHVVSFYGNID
jgi:hypothetical protein